MSQKFLYGLDYVELDPPVEWQETDIQATIEDNAFEASINTNVFTFKGNSVEFLEEWRVVYGVHVGCPLRVVITKGVITEIVFDGMVNMRDREILSRSGPIIMTYPLIEFENNATVFDRISIISQGLLQKQGFITSSDAVDVPVIKESKKNIAERAVILGQLTYQVVSFFIGLIQNFMSAISDIVGISIALGLIEILLLFINAILEITLLVAQVLQHKDLFFPPIVFYKGIKMKTVIEKLFEKEGFSVEFGQIDAVLSKIVLLASQDGFDGFPAAGFPGSGILNTRDWGYIGSEILQTLEQMFNTRQDLRDGVAHIKNRKDPFWDSSPAFTPDDTIVETTLQYQNGTIKEDTDRIKGTVFISYQYDPTDTWTLTDNEDDAFELHRKPINLPDERLNLMKGLQEIQIPYALAVRKQAFDNLFDLFTGITDNFDLWLEQVQVQIQDLSEFIDSNADAGQFVSELLAIIPLGQFIENRSGVLKIDDNAFGIPKLIYMEDGKIPENHKDFVGPRALYFDNYFSESPSIQNDFKGQYINRLAWRIPFSLENYIQTKVNPGFEILSTSGKFTSIGWSEDQGGSAVTDSEQQEIFDTNITEEEV